jgi:DNA-binding Xre family transcriptional regulator
MDVIKQTKEAFKKAVDRVGGRLVRLQEKTGVDYASINRLNSGKNDFKNIPLHTLIKLFPEMDITFFEDERHAESPLGVNLTAAERKIIKIMREINEEGRVDLLTEAGAIRSQHSKNEPKKVRKVS